MADVKVRITPVYIRIGNRSPRVEIAERCIRGGNINLVGKRIRSQCLKSSRQTPLELDLKSLVIGCSGIVGNKDEAEIWVWLK